MILVMVCFVRHAWSGETLQRDQEVHGMGKEIPLGNDPCDGMLCETCQEWGNPPVVLEVHRKPDNGVEPCYMLLNF